ncbi:MAG: NAD(+) synthase [Oscillospiraceae bacterium]|jgi:NAD+ synthase (glutamine-hydrolysing)|nr:NAD(+) synthase [Oscillospiraceae bacterium]
MTTDFGFVKVAALSPRVTVADPMQNAAQSFDEMLHARDAGVQIMVLPELGLSGYTCGDLFGQAALLDGCEAALTWLLEKSAGLRALIAVGLPVRAKGRLYNCAAVLQNGRLLGLVPKQYLPNVREYYEKRWFTEGKAEMGEATLCGQTVPFGQLLFELGGDCCVGVELCEDLWVPAPPSGTMAMQGATVILNLSASDEEVAKNEYRRSLIAQQSGRLRCAYVYAGAGVGESSTDLVFSGACFVAENGTILAENRRFEQEGSAVYSCVDLEMLTAERRFGSFGDAARQADGEGRSLRQIACAPLPPLEDRHNTHRPAALPFVPASLLLRSERCREILEIQTAGLAKRLRHTGHKQIILGLSGGLDSTLALLVATRAAQLLRWEPEQVLCITMPGFGTSAHTRESVDLLTHCLGATLWEIDIRPACELHMSDIGHDPNVRDTTYENVQARERTQILMDLANQENALLLGTGDLSELALGWCTYNADHMSMYNVNGGVPKTLVRHLVEYVMDDSDELTAEALRRVLETPISPELLPLGEGGTIEQKTEDLLGKYEVHDFYLYYFFRFGYAPEKLFFLACRAFEETYTPQLLKDWLVLFLRRFFSQQFKRSCLPDGPKVGSVSLSPRGDWRMPSDAAWKAWVERAEALIPNGKDGFHA